MAESSAAAERRASAQEEATGSAGAGSSSQNCEDDNNESEFGYTFESMDEGTWAVVQAEFEDSGTFKVKFGRSLSGWLHLVQLVERDEPSRMLKWRWWKPAPGTFGTKKKQSMLQKRQ